MIHVVLLSKDECETFHAKTVIIKTYCNRHKYKYSNIFFVVRSNIVSHKTICIIIVKVNYINKSQSNNSET